MLPIEMLTDVHQGESASISAANVYVGEGPSENEHYMPEHLSTAAVILSLSSIVALLGITCCMIFRKRSE